MYREVIRQQLLIQMDVLIKIPANISSTTPCYVYTGDYPTKLRQCNGFGKL